MSKTITKTTGNEVVRKAGDAIYSIIVNYSVGSNLSYKDLKDLQAYLCKKINKNMIDDAMEGRREIKQAKFTKEHLTYITKEDVSKENIESM